MKYGDYDNVTRDVKTLNEILGRQGSGLFLAVIAESVGKSKLQFNLTDEEASRIRESLLSELKEEINERI
jgi:hypothetical protein